MAGAKVEGPEAASGSSSEAQEDSTPSSHYDNLDRASSGQTLDDIAGEHLDPNSEGNSGQESEEAWQTVGDSSSWSSCEIIPLDESQYPAGRGSPVLTSPSRQASGPPEPQSQPDGAQSLLAQHRLERCNDTLERQVAALRDRLERQRRSQSAAEVRIRQVERARAAADHRNATLQADMELFFQTRGKTRTRQRGDEGKRDRRILKSL